MTLLHLIDLHRMFGPRRRRLTGARLEPGQRVRPASGLGPLVPAGGLWPWLV